jgi:Ca-activated chloride channel family protein
LQGCFTENNTLQSQSKNEFVDLWFTKDQQAQKLFDGGSYVEAASKFENLFWVGISYYKAKEFQLAAQVFYQIKTPEGYFNLGMCMAELENWSEAIFAFEQALVLKPDFDEAKFNIAEIKKLIPKKKKLELVTPQSFEDKFLSKSEELDQESDEQGDKEETGGGDEQLQNELAQQMQQGSEQVTFPDGSEQQQQQEQKDILFKQMSDDPAVFLKRKFQMQYMKNAKKIEKPKNKW